MENDRLMFIFLWDRYIYKGLRRLLFLDYALVVQFVMLGPFQAFIEYLNGQIKCLID